MLIKKLESMSNIKYSFKTKPFSHQLAAMGAFLNHLKR